MKPEEAHQVYYKIAAQIQKQGGVYSDWYCGITSDDWEYRLFLEHQVPQKEHRWIALQCYNDTDARAVESALLKLGCDGSAEGGDETTVYVYAYLKGAMTSP